MTTTAAGDAAVARLNKATEAFEKIITGASNQVVDVPGYGNQPTLAARVDERLDETTATSAAEADRSRDEADRATTQATAAANSVTLATAEYNKANTQADRAQSEADRAAQITGLETVADAIGMAALPLPDVWAPLSDSLRLITGYGRDVLVGSDVVARMVNFTRSSTATYIGKDGLLKIAAANEPRFEKEGLLIEGQSTNLVTKSEDLLTWSKNVDATREKLAGIYTKITATGGTSGTMGCYLAGITLVVGKTYTISFWAYAETLASVRLGVEKESSATVNTITQTPTRYTKTFTATQTNGTIIAYSAPGTSGAFVVGGFQLEELPFASSYIPTNGAAVTRAADVCWIPNALNVTPDYGDITITAEVRRNIAIPINLFPRVINISLLQFVVADSTRIMARGGGLEQAVLATAATGKLDRVAATVKGNTIACFLNGAKATMQQTPILPVSEGEKCFIGSRNGLDGLFGHIRNVRIWQRTLSDEQIKATA